MNYIVSDNEYIIGSFKDKTNAIIFLMDCIVNKFKFYLEFLKLNGPNIIAPELNSFKLTTIVNDSTIIRTINKFDMNRFHLVNIMTDENEFISSNSNNILLNYKSSLLKKILNQIKEIKNDSDLNIFIPNNMLNSNIINNIIDSPISADLNCIDNNINLDEIQSNIKKLKLLKNNKEKLVDNITSNFNNNNEKYLQNKIKKLNETKKINKEKEKIDEYKRRYDSDKKIYLSIKDNITDDNIPELFKDQYPILQILEKLNLLDSSKGLEFYYKKMELIKKNTTTIYGTIFNDSSVFYTNKKISEESTSADISDLEITKEMNCSDISEKDYINSDEIEII